MKCPQCGEGVAMRGTVGLKRLEFPDGPTTPGPCPHPCHAAAQAVVEKAAEWRERLDALDGDAPRHTYTHNLTVQEFWDAVNVLLATLTGSPKEKR